MSNDMQKRFDAFDNAISIGGNQAERMTSASRNLQEFLVNQLGVDGSQVFEQGSYPNGTAVEPLDGGEYDVDIVCLSAKLGDSPDDALDRLKDILAGNGNYSSRISGDKASCVRLEYAEDNVGKFHIDVVPVRLGQDDAPLDVPRRGEGWHGTDPQAYTEWCRSQGVNFGRTVKALKRWRDEQQTVRGAIKSIVLQVLAAETMPKHVLDDGKRLSGTLANMKNSLDLHTSPPEILNPVLQSENLAARWTQDSYEEFMGELSEAVDLASRAVNSADPVEAVDLWRELLGDDFPAESPQGMGIRLSNDSHAAQPDQKGWIASPDPRYQIEVSATEQPGKRSRRPKPYESNGRLLFAGKKLRFQARTSGPDDAEIWWQVANTGAHARESSGLRGEYFKAKKLDSKPSLDPAENWEDTSYTGAHWIRAVLVRNGSVVAESEKFVVNIYNKRRFFGI